MTESTATPAPAHAAGSSASRQVALFGGLAIVLLSTVAYVWIQTPLREATELERTLARNVGRIMTLDEILTMSAKMAASAHDARYEQRYNAHVDELDRLLRETLALVPDRQVAAAVASTDQANRSLVELETRSFELDHAGKHAEALQLLEGDKYKADKSAYAAGMDKAFKRLQALTREQKQRVAGWAVALQLLLAASLITVIVAWAAEQRARRRQAARYAADLEAQVAARTHELARRNDAMRLVLDTVQQGLVGVDVDGRMNSERSAAVTRWFGPVTQVLAFSDYVRAHDPQFAQSFELGLDQVREGILPFELCVEQLPKRLRGGERTFAVEYEPMLSDGQLQGFLIVLSDITVQLERERIESEQRDLVRVFECLGRDRQGFLNYLDEANRIIEELTGPVAPAPELCARLLHTLKGNAAQFGMATISSLCHEIEDRFRDCRELQAADRALLEDTWRSMRERIRSMLGDRSHTHMEVDKREFRSVIRLAGRRPEHAEVLMALQAWELDPVQARLVQLGEYARQLAQRMGKPEPQIECAAHGLRAEHERWASFWAACVHLVRNAVDHGIESKEQRASAGKPEQPKLSFQAGVERGRVVVRVSDDGCGIDWDRIAKRAVAQGLSCNSEQERVAALFSDGISTRDEVSDTSGRGVGMSCVRDEVLKRDGQIAITSELGRGTSIEISFAGDSMLDTERYFAGTSLRPPHAAPA